MAQVQILKMEPGADRWQFVAHGARYDLTDATEMVERIKARGARALIIVIDPIAEYVEGAK